MVAVRLSTVSSLHSNSYCLVLVPTIFLPPANEVWGKVMILHVSVILSMGVGERQWLPSMHHRSHDQSPGRESVSREGVGRPPSH